MDANGYRRVMITRLGAVTPLANDVQSSWEQLIAGRGAAGPITAFDTTGFAVMFACEATDFEPMQWIERKQARRMDRCAQLIVAAAQQARADAGLGSSRSATGSASPSRLRWAASSRSKMPAKRCSRVRARAATVEEHDRLLPLVTTTHTGYARCQDRTARLIPIVMLAPENE